MNILFHVITSSPYVCMSLSDHSHMSITTCPNFTKFTMYVNAAVAWSSCDDRAVHYVLPALWMTTSCLPMMGHVANSVYTQSDSPGGRTGGQSVMSMTSLFLLWWVLTSLCWLVLLVGKNISKARFLFYRFADPFVPLIQALSHLVS